MASDPNHFCDRTALQQHRARGTTNDLFLHDHAKTDIKDRLDLVNKSFIDPAIVTGHPEVWQDVVRNAQMVADEDILDLAPDTHDLIVHAMCLHWAHDPIGQIIQCRRALTPDGLFLAVLPGGQTLNELRSALAAAETRTRGGLTPRVAPMGDIRDLGGLLQRAGLALPVADTTLLAVEYATLAGLVQDLRNMGETNALAGRTRSMTGRSLFMEAEAVYADHFPGETRALRASFELITLTGWCPGPNQQQPLRPGSAAHRLADALGTDETSLPD